MGLIHSPRIVTSGLILALDAADRTSYPGSGTNWYDISGNGYHHTTSATLLPISGAYCFDMTTTGQAIPISSTYTFTTTYTLMSWTNPLSDAQTATWRTLWRPTPNDHALIIQDSTDLLGYYDNDLAGFVSYGNTLGGLGLANKWTMFTLTGTGGSSYLYYNDAKYVGSVPYSINGMTHWYIGNTGGTQPFGYVANTLIYNRSLTATEILQNYDATKTRFGL